MTKKTISGIEKYLRNNYQLTLIGGSSIASDKGVILSLPTSEDIAYFTQAQTSAAAILTLEAGIQINQAKKMPAEYESKITYDTQFEPDNIDYWLEGKNRVTAELYRGQFVMSVYEDKHLLLQSLKPSFSEVYSSITHSVSALIMDRLPKQSFNKRYF